MNLNEELTEFIADYERANNTHNFGNVAAFIAPNATYWFTDGSYAGIDAIQKAIEETFAHIQNETYEIRDIRFPAATETVAVVTYTFRWEGIVGGEPKSGAGRGTNVLEKQNGSWKIMHEHLSS